MDKDIDEPRFNYIPGSIEGPIRTEQQLIVDRRQYAADQRARLGGDIARMIAMAFGARS